ncbi:MAG: SDR family NAD(P)-dependent oxidoreductase [Acidimicrobiales bacterium]
MEDLQGKVAVVTGAASGIGLGMARAFAAEGMRVVLADIESPALEAAVAEGFPDGAELLSVVCDVSDGGQVEALRDAAVDRFGTVHVLCNNAGVSSGGPTWLASEDDWSWVLGVNLMGVVHGVRAFTPLMLEQGEGHIVNTASMAGLTSPPGMALYNVSKHAVVALSETLFGDLAATGTDVGVSVLCPGWVNTKIHLAHRNRPRGEQDERDEATEDQQALMDLVGGLLATGLQPEEVAAMVVDAIRTRRFYILTHPEWKPMIEARARRILDEDDPPPAMLPE